MVTPFTIPYQLRPHKAIERNLFISLLKKLDRVSGIDLQKYRYVGFGAPFLEDFKLMHMEFGINSMDCIEYDKFAFSRQQFNNPYSFVKLFNESSTDYISGPDFKTDKSQIIWLDYASPREFRQQLLDIEQLIPKCNHLDIIKVTFNAAYNSFVSSHRLARNPREFDFKKMLGFFKKDHVYQQYYPDNFTPKDIMDDFSVILRAMALRAARRGIREDKSLEIRHLCSCAYADGQMMTTLTMIVCQSGQFDKILQEAGMQSWPFYSPDSTSEIILANKIEVPSMTVLERLAIDKLLPKEVDKLLSQIQFNFGSTEDEHKALLEGYTKFYKYLPYYSRVTY